MLLFVPVCPFALLGSSCCVRARSFHLEQIHSFGRHFTPSSVACGWPCSIEQAHKSLVWTSTHGQMVFKEFDKNLVLIHCNQGPEWGHSTDQSRVVNLDWRTCIRGGCDLICAGRVPRVQLCLHPTRLEWKPCSSADNGRDCFLLQSS